MIFNFFSKKNTVQWTGKNFPEVYGWLIDQGVSSDLVLRILDPGNPHSTIEIQIGDLNFRLDVGNLIVKQEDGTYQVVNK